MSLVNNNGGGLGSASVQQDLPKGQKNDSSRKNQKFENMSVSQKILAGVTLAVAGIALLQGADRYSADFRHNTLYPGMCPSVVDLYSRVITSPYTPEFMQRVSCREMFAWKTYCPLKDHYGAIKFLETHCPDMPVWGKTDYERKQRISYEKTGLLHRQGKQDWVFSLEQAEMLSVKEKETIFDDWLYGCVEDRNLSRIKQIIDKYGSEKKRKEARHFIIQVVFEHDIEFGFKVFNEIEKKEKLHQIIRNLPLLVDETLKSSQSNQFNLARQLADHMPSIQEKIKTYQKIHSAYQRVGENQKAEDMEKEIAALQAPSKAMEYIYGKLFIEAEREAVLIKDPVKRMGIYAMLLDYYRVRRTELSDQVRANEGILSNLGRYFGPSSEEEMLNEIEAAIAAIKNRDYSDALSAYKANPEFYEMRATSLGFRARMLGQDKLALEFEEIGMQEDNEKRKQDEEEWKQFESEWRDFEEGRRKEGKYSLPPVPPIGSENARKILGVSPEASLLEIRKAFRQLALLNHPDKNPNDKDAAKKYIEIINAYETLTA